MAQILARLGGNGTVRTFVAGLVGLYLVTMPLSWPERKTMAIAVQAKVEPQQCPGCGSPVELKRSGSKWKFLCSANKGLNSQCKKEGHWMFSKKDAVRVWNEVK
jgi:hypothetical protein